MSTHPVVAVARSWLGTPWQHQGRLPGVALDCVGLVICAARAVGQVPADWDFNGYARAPDGSMLPLCDDMLTRVPPAEMAPGDVAAIAIGSNPQHMAIVGDYRHGGLSLIHSHSVVGRVVETRMLWSRGFRLSGVWRMEA